MEIVFQYLSYLVSGFFGFIALLIIITLIFGKRVEKKWEYEADFHDENNREIGEFDIEMRKYEKDNTGFQLDATFKLRHPELEIGKIVKVYLNNELVMEGNVQNQGRIYLTNKDLKSDIKNPQEGQICRVMCSATELFAIPIHKD